MSDKPEKTVAPPSRVDALKIFVRDARRFIEEEVWDCDERTLPGLKRRLVAGCRIASIVIRGFIADNCGLQASALTYISLMSMIPVFAVMFSFSKGIGMQKYLFDAIGLERHEITKTVDGKPQTQVEFVVATPTDTPAPKTKGNDAEEGGSRYGLSHLPAPMQKAVTTIFSYVENTRFGTLGLVGFLLLFWAVVKAMSKMESSFNAIWGIHTPRPLFRKFTEYFFVLTLIPVLFLMTTSVNAMLSSPAIVRTIHDWVGPLAGLYQRLLRLFGVAVVIGAFTFLYKFMPNTKVRLFPAAVAGVVGGLLWWLTQWIYIMFQIGITRYNAIYGTFAAVPFFLAWLYVNWTIVLFGAEISFAVQNHRTYRFEGGAELASPAVRVMLGLVLTYEACRAYLRRQGAWCPSEWGRENAIPARLLSSVTETLVGLGILIAVSREGEQEIHVIPGRSPADITLADIEKAFRVNAEQPVRNLAALLPPRAAEIFNSKYQDFIGNLAAITFADLLRDEKK